MSRDPAGSDFCQGLDEIYIIHHLLNRYTDPHHFRTLDGGCGRPCREPMACGHICALNCHPRVASGFLPSIIANSL